MNAYPETIHPRGFDYLREFRLDPFPVFVYQAGGLEIEKRVFMVHGENTTVIEYELRSLDRDPLPECWLEVRPLVAFRDYHGTTHSNDALNPDVEVAGLVARIAPYPDLPALFFSHNASELDPNGQWYFNFEYAVERERGLDYQEDLFNPFLLRFDLNHSATATVIASTGPVDPAGAERLRRKEIARRKAIVDAAPSQEPFVQSLVAAADQYIVQRGDLKTIVAGYHWFTDWGRDTMISLPGLTLVTGRFDVAKQILNAFAQSIDRGMLPNRFPDAGETPEFNTVDATLWFFEAVRAYLEYTGDEACVRELYPKLKDIMDWHLNGTRYRIGVSSDGLLECGEPGVQLTWMDAKIGDFVVTPRTGKPVEIQALWYNALRIMQDFATRFEDGQMAVFFGELADRARHHFNAEFWYEEGEYLYDVVEGDLHDGSIRPNQILAVSLYHTMLPQVRAGKVVDVVQRELLTPLGLRSLSRQDPRYRARYEGGVRERDTAYHQGTVWPWLMGPFITAYIRVRGRSSDSRKQAAGWLKDFERHLYAAGLGHISEIADGEDGHTPRGCIAQAWSVAELLRSAVEDIYDVTPQQKFVPASRSSWNKTDLSPDVGAESAAWQGFGSVLQ